MTDFDSYTAGTARRCQPQRSVRGHRATSSGRQRFNTGSECMGAGQARAGGCRGRVWIAIDVASAHRA
eukprot:2986373-Prymnesium_polylepis.1